MDETAKTLGISVAAVKARLFHARASLRGNGALLLNHEAARHGSRKGFSCAISCTAPFAQQGCSSKNKILLELHIKLELRIIVGKPEQAR